MVWRRRRARKRACAWLGVAACVGLSMGLATQGSWAAASVSTPTTLGTAACTLTLAGSCLVAPAPTPTAGQTQASSCLVDCSLLSTGGGCVASLLELCVVPLTSPAPTPSPSPGLCLGQLGCVGQSPCLVGIGGSCLLGPTPHPSPGGCSSDCPTPHPTPGPLPPDLASPLPGAAAPPGGGGTGTPGSSAFGGGPSAAAPVDLPPGSLSVRAIPVVQPLGLLPELGVAHADLVIPAFAALDVVALFAVLVVVRRSWSGAGLG